MSSKSFNVGSSVSQSLTFKIDFVKQSSASMQGIEQFSQVHITSAELSGLVDSVKRFIVIWLLTDDLFVRGEDMDIWNGRLPQCVTRIDYQRYRCWNDSFFANMWE